MNVATKAKLDSVSVGGDCECHDTPKESFETYMKNYDVFNSVSQQKKSPVSTW